LGGNGYLTFSDMALTFVTDDGRESRFKYSDITGYRLRAGFRGFIRPEYFRVIEVVLEDQNYRFAMGRRAAQNAVHILSALGVASI